MENGQSVFFLWPHTPVGRVRFVRFARVRLLGHALPISLLILRKKPTVLQSKNRQTCTRKHFPDQNTKNPACACARCALWYESVRLWKLQLVNNLSM